MIEEWRAVSESPGYEISNTGNVRRRGCDLCSRDLKVRVQNQGYRQVSIYLPGGKQVTRMVHRLIAIAFVPNPENKPAVNHLDGNKANNAIENLEWVTFSENTRHAYRTGLINIARGSAHWARRNPHLVQRGEAAPRAKLTAAQVVEIKKTYLPRSKDFSQRALARKYGVSQGAIAEIIEGVNWRSVCV